MLTDTAQQPRSIHSEARGPHWVAWVRGVDGKPEQSVVLVGMTREEAEERARRWSSQLTRESA